METTLLTQAYFYRQVALICLECQVVEETGTGLNRLGHGAGSKR